MSDVVNKLWGFCHTLRHDGIDYGDYIEQLTYLLFLKMAEERAAAIPKDYGWASLKDLSGTQLTDHYADILRKLREAGGLLADIFAQATPRFNNPVNLKRVIATIRPSARKARIKRPTATTSPSRPATSSSTSSSTS